MLNPAKPRLGRGIRRALLGTALLAVGASLVATVTTGGPAHAGGKTGVIPGDLLLSRRTTAEPPI